MLSSQGKKIGIAILLIVFTLAMAACDMNGIDFADNDDPLSYTLTVEMEGEGEILDDDGEVILDPAEDAAEIAEEEEREEREEREELERLEEPADPAVPEEVEEEEPEDEVEAEVREDVPAESSEDIPEPAEEREDTPEPVEESEDIPEEDQLEESDIPARDEPLVFEDDRLAETIKAALDKSEEEPLYREEAAELTKLEALNRGITSLAGIQQLTSLEQLFLMDNQISDLTPRPG